MLFKRSIEGDVLCCCFLGNDFGEAEVQVVDLFFLFREHIFGFFKNVEISYLLSAASSSGLQSTAEFLPFQASPILASQKPKELTA